MPLIQLQDRLVSRVVIRFPLSLVCLNVCHRIVFIHAVLDAHLEPSLGFIQREAEKLAPRQLTRQLLKDSMEETMDTPTDTQVVQPEIESPIRSPSYIRSLVKSMINLRVARPLSTDFSNVQVSSDDNGAWWVVYL